MRLTASLLIFRRPAILVFWVIVVLSLSRLILVGLHWDRVSPTDGLMFILLSGIRFDIILIGILFGPIFLLRPWFHAGSSRRRAGLRLLNTYTGLATSLAFFVEASSKSFIDEFDSRPNYLFVEYLSYPKEVFATLAGAHLLELLAFTGITLAIAVLITRWLRRDHSCTLIVPLKFCLLITPLTMVLVFLMIRSTLDHRPVNPSIAAFSHDAMVNQLPLNSPYSLLYAIYEHRRDSKKKSVRYGAMQDEEALAIILNEAGISAEQQLDPSVPTLHHQQATRNFERPLNLVIILEESLGAEFVGSLGGRDLTPELDKMADEGIWMEQLYATGTRSARGIEAIISSFTPTPLNSTIKLAETQENFFTIASLLKNHGYQTSFIYGGESHFDNMKRFFLNNGFDTVVDENDYEQPEFMATWGVSDEDLFKYAHEVFENAGQQPFFSLVFTSSNHKPFEIPADRVTPETGPEGPRETAIKYADYALGRFIDQARQSSYWENTVFLVIADHNSRVFGHHLVPIERFQIPGVILGGSIEPRRISGISSQIDMVPTLLSLIGISSNHPSIGRDLTSAKYADGAGRAMMQFNALQAYMEDQRVVVLQPDLPAMSFKRVSADQLDLDKNPDPDMERRALAYAHWGPMMIRNKSYRN